MYQPNLELKPCPFCGRIPNMGAEVKKDLNTSAKWWFVICGCGADGPPDLGWSGAADKWNTRVGDVEFESQPNLLNNDESLGIHPTARCIRCGGAMEILDMRCANECE
jgi:hypothetical protein